MSAEDFNRSPDWTYVQQTLVKSSMREWQRWFDFWSGRTALNILENARTMTRTSHTKTRTSHTKTRVVERGE